MHVTFLFGLQIAKYFRKAGGEKFDVVQMGRSIYQIDRIFKENPDLDTVFTHLSNNTCYSSITAGERRKGGVTLPKWHVCYIKMTVF